MSLGPGIPCPGLMLEMGTMTELENSPAQFRFLHTSDWQLGMPANFLEPEARARFADARLEAVERLFALAQEQCCEAIVVAGDVFDNNLLRPEVYRRAIDVLRTSPVSVYLLPGNHDPFDAASIYRKPEFAQLAQGNSRGVKVEVLQDFAPLELREGVEIVGAPLLTKKPNEDLVARAIQECEQRDAEGDAEGVKNRIRVLVGHGNVSTFGDDNDLSTIDVAAAEDACARRVIDYVALGDTHSAMSLGSTGRVWYSGAPEVTAFREPHGGGENNSGKALVVDISVSGSEAHVDVEEFSIGRWAFQAVEAEINSRAEAQSFVESVQEMANKRNLVVKYALKGTVDLHTAAWLDQQLEESALGFARLYPRERLMDLHVVPDLDELAEANFGEGFIDSAAKELMESAQEDNRAASDALRLLYRLSAATRKDAV